MLLAGALPLRQGCFLLRTMSSGSPLHRPPSGHLILEHPLRVLPVKFTVFAGGSEAHGEEVAQRPLCHLPRIRGHGSVQKGPSDLLLDQTGGA